VYLCAVILIESVKIKFCIITCTYNAESLIQRTMDNVASQSWGAIHHIIIDGASTDKTIETAKHTAERYKGKVEYTIVSEPDKGLYYAMNKGLQHATPDYVLFLNAGDTLHSEKTLEEIGEQFQNEALNPQPSTLNPPLQLVGLPEQEPSTLNPQPSTLNPQPSTLNPQPSTLNPQLSPLPGVIYGDTDIVDVTNHFVGKREHNPPEKLTWKSFQDGMLVCHQAFYVRTDIAQRVAFDTQYRFSADVDWCIRVMKEVEKEGLELRNMHSVLCDFLAGGLTIKNHRASLHERFRIMTKHYGLLLTLRKHLGFLFGKRK